MPTDIEEIVRDELRALNIDFTEQFPTRTGFVLDFAIPSRNIAIEVDGPHHDNPRSRSRDAFRTLILKREGWKVYRIHHSQIDQVNKILKEVLQNEGRDVSRCH